MPVILDHGPFVEVQQRLQEQVIQHGGKGAGDAAWRDGECTGGMQEKARTHTSAAAAAAYHEFICALSCAV